MFSCFRRRKGEGIVKDKMVRRDEAPEVGRDRLQKRGSRMTFRLEKQDSLNLGGREADKSC